MILLDTNVIIDYWRNLTPKKELAMVRLDPYICGVVLAELLQGTSNKQEAAKMQEALSEFRWLEIRSDVWHRLGLNLAALRRVGLNVPFQDTLLATMAIRHNAQIWSKDKHFVRIQQVLPALQLFTPEIES